MVLDVVVVWCVAAVVAACAAATAASRDKVETTPLIARLSDWSSGRVSSRRNVPCISVLRGVPPPVSAAATAGVVLLCGGGGDVCFALTVDLAVVVGRVVCSLSVLISGLLVHVSSCSTTVASSESE